MGEWEDTTQADLDFMEENNWYPEPGDLDKEKKNDDRQRKNFRRAGSRLPHLQNRVQQNKKNE